MIAKWSSWKVAATVSALLACVGGCQTVSSWLPNHDKVTEARQNATARAVALSPAITPREKMNVELAVAQSLEEENHADQAAKVYQGIIKRDSGCVAAYQRLGALYAKKGEWELAHKNFDLAVAKDPKNLEIQCDLGYCLYLQHRDNEAEACLRRVLTADADNARAHNNLGLLLARNGRQDDALAEFFKAGCSEGQAHANLGMAYSVESRLPEAEAQYRAALAAEPGLATAKGGLAALEAVRKSGNTAANKVAQPTPPAPVATPPVLNVTPLAPDMAGSF